MRGLLAFLCVLAGIAASMYLGICWALIGGVLLVVEQVRAPELSSTQVAYGVIRVLLAGPIYTLTLMPFWLLAGYVVPEHRKKGLL